MGKGPQRTTEFVVSKEYGMSTKDDSQNEWDTCGNPLDPECGTYASP
jgi:hypothetical protein